MSSMAESTPHPGDTPEPTPTFENPFAGISEHSDLLMLLHGDKWIRDSGHEGGKMTSNLAHIIVPFLKHYKQNLPETHGSPEEIKKLETIISKLNELWFHAHTIDLEDSKELAEVFSTTISEMKPGQTLTLPGGWRSRDAGRGHALIYEIERQPDGGFSFTIYNTGAGIEHHQSMFTSSKQKFLPTFKVKDIPSENMADKSILKALMELQTELPGPAEEYKPEHIYRGILPLLQGTLEPTQSEKRSDFITPQRAGTCSMKVINAYIRAQLGDDLPLYKKIKFYEKFQSLEQFFREAGTELEESDVQFLGRALENLSRSALKLRRDNLISEEEMKRFIDFRDEVHASIKGRQRLMEEVSVPREGLESQLCRSDKAGGLVQALTGRIVDTSAPTQSFEPQRRIHAVPVAPLDRDNVRQALDRYKEAIANMKREGQQQDILPFLQRVFQTFPTPEHGREGNLWDSIKPEDVVPVRDAIHELTREFYISLQGSTSPYDKTEAYINSVNNSFIVFLLSQRAPDTHGLLQGKGILLSPEGVARHTLLSVFKNIQEKHYLLNASQLNRIEKLLDYYNRQPHARLHFNLSAFAEGPFSPAGATELDITSDSIHDEDEDIVVLREIMGENPRIRERFQAESRLITYSTLFCDSGYDRAAPEGPTGLLPRWYHELRDMRCMSESILAGKFYREADFSMEATPEGLLMAWTGEAKKIKIKYKIAPKSFDNSELTDQGPLRGNYGMHSFEYIASDKVRGENSHLINEQSFILSTLPVQDKRSLTLTVASGRLQVHAALDFFYKNIDLLRECDYRQCSMICFFKRALLRGGYDDSTESIDAVLLKHPEVLKQFQQLLDRGLGRCNRDVSLLSYFAILQHTLQAHVDVVNSSEVRPKLQFTHHDFRGELKKLFKSYTDVKTKIEIAKTLLLTVSESAAPSEEETLDILKYSIFLRRFYKDRFIPVKEGSDPLDLTKLLYENRERIAKVLNSDNLNLILHELNILEPSKTLAFREDSESLIFRSTTDGYTLDITDGNLFVNGLPFQGLPKEIIDSDIYHEVFGEESPALVGGGGCFKNTNDTLRIKVLGGGAVSIQAKILPQSGEWYQAISSVEMRRVLQETSASLPQNLFGGLIPPQTFKRSYTYWVNCDPGGKRHVIIVDNETKKPRYKLNISGEDVTLARLNDNGAEDGFVLQNIYSQAAQNKFITRLTKFEHIEHLLMFKNSTTNESFIEMPRLGLTFDIRGERAYLRSNPTLFLSTVQESPLLGNMKSYLILQNDAGEKFVLLGGESTFNKQNSDILCHGLSAYSEKSLREQPIMFKLDAAGRDIIPLNDSTEQQLRLALNFLAGGNYKLCIKHLKKAWKDRPYSKEGLNLLGDLAGLIRVTKDHSPESYGAVAFAAHLISESLKGMPESHPDYSETVKKVKEIFEAMGDQIVGAIKMGGNVPSYMRLQPQKELELLDFISESGANIAEHAILVKRKIDLEERQEQILYTPSVMLGISLINKIAGITHMPNTDGLNREPKTTYGLPPSPGRVTYSQNMLRDSFPYLYREAVKCREAGKRRQWDFLLKLNFLSVNASTEDAKKRLAVLTAVCLSPESPIIEFAEEGGKILFPDITKTVNLLLRYYSRNEEMILQKARQLFSADKVQELLREEEGRAISFPRHEYEKYTLPPEPADRQYLSPQPLSDAARLFGRTEAVPESRAVTLADQADAGSQMATTLHKKLIDGIAVASRERTISYTLDPAKIGELERTLSSRLTEGNARSEILLKEILAQLNAMPGTPAGSEERLQTIGRTKERIKFSDCLLFLLQRDVRVLKDKNPHLTPEAINEVYHKLVEYLILKVRSNQIKNAQRILSDIPRVEEPSRSLLIQKLGEELSQERGFDPYKNPEYLVFEYKSGMMIRPKNIEVLHALRGAIEAGEGPEAKDLIYQLIMGGGKTKVILPLLGLTLANQQNFVSILVPGSLYETNSEDLGRLMQEFGRKIYRFNFEREQKYTLRQLKALEEKFIEIQHTRGCMISTPESVQSLMLKYIETLSDLHSNTDGNAAAREELKEKAAIMQRMLKTLHDKGLGILDEADVILNCRRELNYTVGEPSGFEQVRWTFACEIFDMLDGIGPHLRVDGISKDIYNSSVKGPLVDRLATYFFERVPRLPVTRDELKAYITSTEGSGGVIDRIKEYTRTMPPSAEREELVNKIILAKEYVSHILPYTLTKKCSVNYGRGLYDNYELAVPYVGNRKPSLNSKFGHPDVLIAFTLQNAFLNGLSLEQTRKFISFLQSERADELRDSASAMIGEEVSAINLSDACEVAAVHERIRKNRAVVRYYYNTLVFPEMNNFGRKLSSSSQDIGGHAIFKRKLGFTGTPNNSVTYPSNITVAESVEENGKVLLSLLNRDVADIRSVGIGRPQEAPFPPEIMLNELMPMPNFPEYRALIDCGSHFAGIANADVAGMLLERVRENPKIDGIIYFDDATNELVVLNKENKIEKYDPSKCPPERYFTYYDQYHTTGTDIKQAPTAKAFLTVGRNLTTRDIFQGAMRMRGLGKGQTVTFVVPPSLGHIQDIPGVIRQAEYDEAQQLTSDLLFSTIQKMEQIEREAQWAKILSTEVSEITPRDYSKMIIRCASSLWATCRLVEGRVNTRGYLEGIVASKPPELREKLQGIVEEALKRLPAEVEFTQGKNLGHEVQQQQEQEQERETEREQETLVDPGGRADVFREKSFGRERLTTTHEFWDLFPADGSRMDFVQRVLMPIHEMYGDTTFIRTINKEHQGLGFADNIFATENFLKTTYSREPISRYMKTPYFYLEVWKAGETTPKILLLSRRDADEMALKIEKVSNSGDVQVILRGRNGQLIAKTPDIALEPQGSAAWQAREHESLMALAQIKFLQGETCFPERLREKVSQWIQSADKSTNEARKAFFKKLSECIYSKKRLEGSDLGRMFDSALRARRQLIKRDEFESALWDLCTQREASEAIPGLERLALQSPGCVLKKPKAASQVQPSPAPTPTPQPRTPTTTPPPSASPPALGRSPNPPMGHRM